MSTQCAFISRTPQKIQPPVVRRGAIAVQLCYKVQYCDGTLARQDSNPMQTTQTVKIPICCLFKKKRLAETCNSYDEMKIKHSSVEGEKRTENNLTFIK